MMVGRTNGGRTGGLAHERSEELTDGRTDINLREALKDAGAARDHFRTSLGMFVLVYMYIYIYIYIYIYSAYL